MTKRIPYLERNFLELGAGRSYRNLKIHMPHFVNKVVIEKMHRLTLVHIDSGNGK